MTMAFEGHLGHKLAAPALQSHQAAERFWGWRVRKRLFLKHAGGAGGFLFPSQSVDPMVGEHGWPSMRSTYGPRLSEAQI